MHTFAFVVALAAQASFGVATPLCKRAVDYFNPNDGGGSMLNNAGRYLSASVTYYPTYSNMT